MIGGPNNILVIISLMKGGQIMELAEYGQNLEGSALPVLRTPQKGLLQPFPKNFSNVN